MTIPSFNTIAQLLTLIIGVFAALTTAFWFSLVIWAFRDMRMRSRDPFAQILAGLLVAALPFVGAFIYLILRPPETLAERYERALEEEALLQEIEERPHCPECGRTVLEGWVICPACRGELQKQCIHCYQLLDLNWGVCPYCTTLQPAQHPPFNRAAVRPLLLRSGRAAPAIPAPSINGEATERGEPLSAVDEQRTQPVKAVGSDHPTIVNLPTRGQAAPERRRPVRATGRPAATTPDD